MNLQVENNIARIAEEARGRYFAMLDEARSRTANAAEAVSKAKGPVHVVSNMGLKLAAASHKTSDKVVKQQARLVENQIDAVAGSLRAAAGASDFRDLVRTQLRLIPENAGRYVADVRDTVSILAGAGQEVGSIVKGTVEELRGKKPTAKATTRKKVSKKKVAKKKVAKKKASKKKAVARKVKPATSAPAQKAA